MTDFEKIVAKLRDKNSPYEEGNHFEIWHLEDGGKELYFRTSILENNWISFKFNKDENLLDIC